MENKILKRKYIKTIIFCSFLLILGIIFVIAGIGLVESIKTSGWRETQGTIIAITSKDATIEFFVDGKPIQGISTYYTNLMKIGDVFKVRYNPINPNEFITIPPVGFKLAFIIPGSLMSLVSITIIGFNIKNLIFINKSNMINNNLINESSINKYEDSKFRDTNIKIRNIVSNVAPSSLFEYKELNDENTILFRFRINKDDQQSYIVENRNKDVCFYTQLLGDNKYKLIPIDNGFKSEIVFLEILNFANKEERNDDYSIKINGLGLKEYFYNRHVTYSCEVNENGYVYTLFNNLKKFAEIHEIIYDKDNKDNFNERMLIILSNKESIDDASLFSLCVSKRKKHEIGFISVKQ